ncbi:alpha-amylase family glycosyl hydrolase [Treponema sp.]|uniref:alpha-amylase family glycosyl hydrolase n=1 Tax=Treponema sp. TaxID=166 RepID=UPI0025E733D0|nr:alpha-amylase family glycosyl hydrolase [Treponema sp.]MCR5218334.1 alpha-amylase [Treponema sp.]
MNISYNEFHISRKIRDLCNFNKSMFASSGNVILANFKAVQEFQILLNQLFESRGQNEKKVSAGSLNAMGLIDEVFHLICMLFRKNKAPLSFTNLLSDLDTYFKKEKVDQLLLEFMEEFPPVAVYNEELSAEEYLAQTCIDPGTEKTRTNREQVLEEMILLHLANENPAFHPFAVLFDDEKLKANPLYIKSWNQIKAFFKTQPVFGPKNNDLITMLKEPVIASPTSLKGQLDYIRTYWKDLLADWLRRLLEGMDTLSEEEKAAWHPTNGGEVSMDAYSYENLMKEYERFSPDREWMPKVVLMAKTVLVWLYQLSKKYNRDINRLDQIPDEELDALRDEGFTGLWLIGLWERSYASRRIKQINGNPEAAASAYSLLDYEIAGNLGGWGALENLRARCWARGIRLASDMVPNHTGMDGKWVIEHPDYFISSKDNPFPQYNYDGEDLCQDGRVSVYLENHYYSKTDCAVCFKRVDNYTGDVTYIYHGNDGTGMPWNDTAQIDFLNPEAREAVMQQILKVARNFPIIRFDAAMVLAKKHIRRLWYPEPGHGGDIATRSRYSLTSQQFEDAIPNEFWREVVDRCAQEMPDTLLLAEAFWMMEGYFTRTLGMHRVYNSAFMNMLKKEENQKYRDTVKNTIKFDPQVLKRFVNFMNNPDEETAVAQFGKGDKYFGVCTLMITMPGLPMFGHGQLEGFEEKYGMEYTRAYKDEQVDEGLMNRHRHDIFPLMHKRYLFAGVENFLFYDVWKDGSVNENIFAYSNGTASERTLVFYNNKYEHADGWIKQSCEYAVKTGSGENDKTMYTKSVGEGLGLTYGDNHFVIFKEHRSGLWYVRRSNDILNQGMFVSLNGFEYQVYLNMQQVADGADKKYETLCNLLNGRGVTDLDVAWQEYKYKDLYAALENFMNEDFLKTLDQIKDVKKPAFTKIVKGLKEEALAYYQEEVKFQTEVLEAEEENKASEKTKTSGKNAVSKKTVSKKTAAKIKVPSAAQRWTAFTKNLDLIFASKEIKSAKDGALLTGTASAVLSCGSKNCLAFGLDRKLGELIVKAKIKDQSPKYEYTRIFITAECAKAKKAADIGELLTGQEYGRLLSGANDFNGIRWFNKELFESALSYSYFAMLLAKNASAKKILTEIEKACAKAEYQCQLLMEALTGKKKTSAKKASSTSTVKKAPAKKASSTSTTKKTTAKKTAGTSTVKKAPAKKTASTSTAKKAPAKKTSSTSTAKKTTAKKTAATSTAKKTTAKKTAGGKKSKK